MSRKSSRDQSGGRLLRDIEEISKALYVRKTPPKALTFPSDHGQVSVGDNHVSRSKSDAVFDDLLHKLKKSSIWSWKPLKALSHIHQQRFNCSFFLQVHTIEGLPVNFKDLALCVNWIRKDKVMRTRPAHVSQGMAEFEETLIHCCSVYGSMTGHQHSAKYKPKLFQLHVSVIGAPALEIGKHWIDLTRLLPLTLKELEGRRNSGNWTTTFKLTGKAKGAMLNVSFGFCVLGSKSIEPSEFVKGIKPAAVDDFSEFDGTSGNIMLQRLGSVPGKSAAGAHFTSRSLDARSFDKVLSDHKSELARSISFLYRKLEEGKLDKMEDFDLLCQYLEPVKPNSGISSESSAENTTADQKIEFAFSELGIESSMKEQLKSELCSYEIYDNASIETIDVADLFEDSVTVCNETTEYNKKHDDNRGESTMKSGNYEETDACKDGMLEELESIFLDLFADESAELDSPEDIFESIDQEDYMYMKSSYKSGRRVKSLSLDDVTESVANDFLDMLSIEQTSVELSSDSCLDSPRERLLRQFEKEALSSGNSIFDFDATDDPVELSGVASTGHGRVACSDDFDLPFIEVEKEQKRANKTLRSKRNLKMVENLEAEALMRDWGLNEKAFHNSPRTSAGGFGSPIYLSPERQIELPPLGEGLGSSLRTRNGSLLCTMSPPLFRNARNGARLIMQVSCPVVLPAAMGSSAMEILSCWASEGAAKMSIQADKLMPLEDITWNIIQDMAWEAGSSSELDERWSLSHDLFGMKKNNEDLLFHQSSDTLDSTSVIDYRDSGFLSLEDLAPLAMDKIEPLTIEGLRIQSNLSENEAPSSIRPHFSEVFGYHVATELQLGNGKERDDDKNDVVELSVSLDEWMRLDAGDFDNKPETKKRIMKILVAHHAESLYLSSPRLESYEERLDLLGRECGRLSDKLTLALRVQLRDPFRDYEMVGNSMLILIQLERSYAPVDQDRCSRASETNSCSENDLNEQFIPEEMSANENERAIHTQAISQFKITEIHVSGFNVDPSGEQIWGTKRQQQSGSRWLLSSGMGRTSKRPFSKSNAIIRSSSPIIRNMCPGDVLWSISSDFHVGESKWIGLATSSTYVRNPDIVFPTGGHPKYLCTQS